MRILAACKNCNAQYDVSGQKPNDSLRCRCGGLIIVPEVRAQETRLVRCASCGAVRGAGGLNCEFCGARFSTVDRGWGSMCPKCFCRLPSDAQFCVECGVRINPQKLDAIRSDLLCPRCAMALQGRVLEQLELFECAACAGLWVPTAVFAGICQKSEVRGDVLKLAGMGEKRRRFELTPDEQVKYIPCPCCKRLMNRRNFAGISGVIIDVCRDDGVWLDNQELNRIVQFIESGGMDKAQAAEARDREHSERMQAKPVAVLPAGLEIGLSREHISIGTRSGTGASLVGRVLIELAETFFRGL